MFDYILLAIALIGTALAGLIDLKTTEIPDVIPFSMAVGGLLIHGISSWLSGNWIGLIYSVGVGLGFLGFGYLLYFTGQWGEADVLMLASLGVLIPQPLVMFNISVIGLLFPLIFLLNTFIIGGVYSIIYAFALGFKEPKVFSNFFKDVKGNAKSFFIIIALVIIGCTALFFSLNIPFLVFFQQLILYIPLIIAILLLYRFALVIDNTVFKKKIKTKNLKEGDVLAEKVNIKSLKFSHKLFIGLEKKQIKEIQKVRKTVLIKEGIRYSITFFFSVLATWFFGNLIFLIFGIVI